MGKLKIPLIILLGILSFSACEKDDICVDGDTPQLVIRFYDQFDTTALREVQALEVKGVIDDEVFDVIPNVSLTEIKVPLRADATTTSFLITRNLDPEDPDTADIDTLILNYDLNKKFVSRACGFVMNFSNIQASIPIDSNNWTTGIEVITTSLTQNDTIANVKIFH